MQLTEAAARGDLAAAREQLRLVTYLDRKNILRSAPPGRDRTTYEIEEEESTKLFKLVLVVRGLMYLKMRSGCRAHFESQRGPLEGFYDVRPRNIDLEYFWENCGKLKRRLKAGKREEYDVGYGKPPEASRWIKGESGNPSGQRRKHDDAWESFRVGLVKTIPVTVDGMKTSSTTIAVACTQLFAQAIKGKPEARRLVRNLIVLLDERGLLTAPEREQRRRRPGKTALPETSRKALTMALQVVLIPELKRDMLEAYTSAYGPVPEFETDYERGLPTLDDIEGYRELMASRERRAPDRRTGWQGGE